MKYDVITDHYAAAMQIGQSREYAARLDIADLRKCLEIANDEVLKAVQINTGTGWSWSELNDEEFYSVFQRAIHEIKDTSARAFVKAMNFIPSEIERREYDSERMEQAAEMLDYMEQVRKEQTERNNKDRPIQAIDVIRFYRYFSDLFPNEEPGKVPDMERRKKWARRHGYNAGTIRNAEMELIKLKEKEPEADAKCWPYIAKIGPEKVAYIVNQITEPEHKEARDDILFLVAEYRENH
jgi:hypothetical protein